MKSSRTAVREETKFKVDTHVGEYRSVHSDVLDIFYYVRNNCLNLNSALLLLSVLHKDLDQQ